MKTITGACTAMLGCAILAACGGIARPSPPEIGPADGVEAQVLGKIEQLRARVAGESDSWLAWSRLGKAFHAHGMLTHAAQCYAEATRLQPSDYRWPYLHGLTLVDHDLSATRPLLATAAANNPAHPAVHINYGEALLRLGADSAAGQQFERALTLVADDPHAMLGMAHSEMAANNLGAARGWLERAITSAPHFREAHTLLAQLYRREGDDEPARLAELKARTYSLNTHVEDPDLEAVRLEAVDSLSQRNRAIRLLNTGDYESALRAWQNLVLLESGTQSDQIQLAATLFALGRDREALALLDEIGAAANDNPRLLTQIARVHEQRRDWSRAQRFYQAALDRSPGDTDASLGQARLQLRDYPALAHSTLLRAWELNPTAHAINRMLANVLTRLDRRADAGPFWQRALAQRPDDIRARIELADLHIDAGQHPAALDLLNDGLFLAPGNPEINRALARLAAVSPELGDRL